MTPLVEANGAAVYHADWRALLDVVPTCDALIVDAPYSQRTHAGHDDGVSSVENMRNFATLTGGQQKDRAYAARKAALGLTHRRSLSYSAWSPDDVRAFVAAWSPRVKGWFVTITDDVLAPAWQAALDAAGRYAFAPLPFVAPGSRVRLTGDGPSNWTCWIIVARPRSREFAKWGTLPGAYVLPPGEGGSMPVVGGKPRWIMERLIEDYSRPGDLIVDPCCGAGTTLAAAVRIGRRAVGGDVNQEHAEMASRWVIDPGPTCPTQDQARQRVLF